MIRSKHAVDTTLVNLFISESKYDNDINEALMNWYSSLGDKNHQTTRNNAIEFLKRLSKTVLTEIDYPMKEREELVKIFEPLELLLRTALPLGSPDDRPLSVRDHLSHTVRNILFSTFLLRKYNPDNFHALNTQLVIATIFHDLAYPIEKIKKVAHKLGDATFRNLLNSKGEVEIILNSPDVFLEMLDFFGKTITDLETEANEAGPSERKEAAILLAKVQHIYREIISKAIAGKGLFDASHAISSVVLFLRPVVKYWNNSKQYKEGNLKAISDICLTMTYHDRNYLIQNITAFGIPLILRILRIADELQEWDRESNSFIADEKIESDPATILSVKLIMKNKGEAQHEKCKAEYFIPDKISGLTPALNDDEKIKVSIDFPDFQSKRALESYLQRKKQELQDREANLNYVLEGDDEFKNALLIITHNLAQVTITK